MATKGKVDPKKEKEPVNVVHKNQINTEKIQKEMKHFGKNVNEHFQLNPHNSFKNISGLISSIHSPCQNY